MSSHKEILEIIVKLNDNEKILELYEKGKLLDIDMNCYYSTFKFWEDYAIFLY